MAALNGAVKVFIVERLACFDKPTEVARAVKQEFGITVSLPQLTAYNPTLAAGQRLSQTLKDVFHDTRKRFLKDTSTVAIAHKAYRLRVLDRMLEKVENTGNILAAAQLLEQAAKEEGGAFTNKHKLEHAGKGGGPLTVVVKSYKDLKKP